MILDEMSVSEARARVYAQDRLDWVDLFVNLSEATGDPDSPGLNPNQIFCISDYHQYQAAEKGRQEGHSFAFAADSIARSMTEDRTQSVHISTDKWEAQKKQIYCMRIIESLRDSAKKFVKVVGESKERITFSNGSFIDFLACRPPRGADRASVYLDELAFMPGVAEIMKAALGCTTHGGYIRVASTHCGGLTEFFKIVRNQEDEWGNKPYEFWNRGYFPWWTCPNLCIDVESAMELAPAMTTPERVNAFGNEKIKNVFRGYPVLADFQEEFECMVVDEAHAFFPMPLIHRCYVPNGIDEYFDKAECKGSDADPLYEAKALIDRLAREIMSGNIPGDWYWAYDVGRRIDKDEITIGNDFNNVLGLRAVITMDNMPFERKEEICHYLINNLPVIKGHVDGTHGSMGEHLSEILFNRYGQRAMPFGFTNQSKAVLATDMKIRMERVGLMLPVFPALIRQIHAIKRNVTTHGNITYGVEENKEHHGDKFWSLAMLSALADNPVQTNGFAIQVVQYNNPYGIPKNPTSRGMNRPGEIWTPTGIRR